MNPTQPIVSVVIPTYNQDQYLPETIDSVLNQTMTDFELIIVNDGSTDRTHEILDDYSKEYPEICVVHQANQKLPRTLNTGFQRAKGKFLTWTSSDNRMLPNMLETMLKVLRANETLGMVYSDWNVINDNGDFVRCVPTFDFDRFLLMRLNFINASFMYRRECQERIGLYEPSYMYVEDWEYWLRICSCFKAKRIPICLYDYRVHGESLSGVGGPRTARVQAATRKLQQRMMKNSLIAWLWSKIVFELHRWKFHADPRVVVQPYVF